jgi:hypothetical protein
MEERRKAALLALIKIKKRLALTGPKILARRLAQQLRQLRKVCRYPPRLGSLVYAGWNHRIKLVARTKPNKPAPDSKSIEAITNKPA